MIAAADAGRATVLLRASKSWAHKWLHSDADDAAQHAEQLAHLAERA
jgi:hypothetical protein